MLLDARTYGLLLTLSVYTPLVVSQPLSGCPSYGCTPTGSFSLLTSAGIPRSGVKVIWTTQISNSSGTGSRLLGCVSNNGHVVCPTPEGYLGLDGDTGKVLWRDNHLANPTLPIMDVMGDVIGTNGSYLSKIDGDGTVEKPVIPLDPPMAPIYSIEFGDQNMALLVSQTGELVSYLTNGIPMASLFLRGNVESYNGTFHPIAQPVINGSRAYILTQFKPDPQYTDIPREKLVTLALQRLYAMDVRDTMVKPINLVWYLNMEMEVNVRCRLGASDTPQDSSKPGRTGTEGGNAPEENDFRFRKVNRQSSHPSEAEMPGDARLTFRRQEKHSEELLEKLTAERHPIRFGSQGLGMSSSRTNANRNFHGLKKNKPGLMDLMTSQNVVQMKQNSNIDSQTKSRSNLEGSESLNKKSELNQDPSVLYFFGTVMVSVGPPEGLCDAIQTEAMRQCCLETAVPKLWGIKDNGLNMTVSFTADHPLLYMSVYDSSYKPPRGGHPLSKMSVYNSFYTPPRGGQGNKNKKTDHGVGEGSLVWAVTQFGDVIVGFDQISGQFQQIVNVTHMLNTSIQITSRVMVGVDNGSDVNVLIFGIRRTDKTQTFKMADSMHTTSSHANYLVAIDTSYGDAQANVLWVVPVPNDYEVQGQISVAELMGSPDATFVVTAQGPASQIAFGFKFTRTP